MRTNPGGLWRADFDLLTRLPGLERVDVVATEEQLATGLLERLHNLLPGLEEVRVPPAAGPLDVPVLVVPRDRRRTTGLVLEPRSGGGAGRPGSPDSGPGRCAARAAPGSRRRRRRAPAAVRLPRARGLSNPAACRSRRATRCRWPPSRSPRRSISSSPPPAPAALPVRSPRCSGRRISSSAPAERPCRRVTWPPSRSAWPRSTSGATPAGWNPWPPPGWRARSVRPATRAGIARERRGLPGPPPRSCALWEWSPNRGRPAAPWTPCSPFSTASPARSRPTTRSPSGSSVRVGPSWRCSTGLPKPSGGTTIRCGPPRSWRPRCGGGSRAKRSPPGRPGEGFSSWIARRRRSATLPTCTSPASWRASGPPTRGATSSTRTRC